jgi:cytochrome c553
MTKLLTASLLLSWATTLSLAAAEPPALPLSDTAKSEFFEKKIRPLLVERCYECHSETAKKVKGGLRLDNREDLLKGGDTGPSLVSGNPDKSLIIVAVRYKNQDLQMPPKSPLKPEQIRDLEQWVKMGAPDPREKVASKTGAKRVINLEEGRKFWSFQPIANPPVPTVKNPKWIQSPLDNFILAKLEEKKLKPAPAADKRTLLRRATFDLTGLPPTPAEIDAFLADKSPKAFATVVDRLLSSPQYGERWGRHWLDVARYADSNGLDENVAFGNAWRYRDYVVNAFNHDKPYNQFIIEQLAGDLLPPTDNLTVKHERLTALGFLCIGPKVLAEPDKVKLEMDLIDEQIETLGRAFLGATLGCARCHDHKFDPVPTDDYYSLAAIFKSTRTMDDLKTIAKWHEPQVALPEDFKAQDAYAKIIANQKLSITNFVSQANQTLLAERKTNALPANPESQYPTNTVAELKKLREALAKLEKDTPELPSTMGVMEGTNILKAFPVHIRGSHLTLGKEVPRGVPQVMTISTRPQFDDQHSGRLELARWLASAEHPLTARVMVNRIWRWHFGQGLVASTDNFGTLGERPSHPELLDWLARRFIAEGWSIKAMHRVLMLSSVYQTAASVERTPSLSDPENRLLARFPLRRLDAEEIRDALHFVAGTLDLTMGGKTIPLKNREFVFDHTSKDATSYDSPRRAVYLPVIRNHLYDLFEQFDFPDPAVPTGSRNATVVAPQALLMMNSELVGQAAAKLATQLLAHPEWPDVKRVELAYVKAYGRTPTSREMSRAQNFLDHFERTVVAQKPDAKDSRVQAWSVLCQTILAANEFIYLN